MEKTKKLLNLLADAYDQLDKAKNELDEFTYKHCEIQLTGMIEEILIISKNENWTQKNSAD